MDGWAQCRKGRVADIGLLVGRRREGLDSFWGGCARRKSGLLNMQICGKAERWVEVQGNNNKMWIIV